MPKRRRRRRRDKAGRAQMIQALTQNLQKDAQSAKVAADEPKKISQDGVVATKRKKPSSQTTIRASAKRTCTRSKHTKQTSINVPQQAESVCKLFNTVLERFSQENSLDSGTLSDRLNSKHRSVLPMTCFLGHCR